MDYSEKTRRATKLAEDLRAYGVGTASRRPRRGGRRSRAVGSRGDEGRSDVPPAPRLRRNPFRHLDSRGLRGPSKGSRGGSSGGRLDRQDRSLTRQIAL